MPYSVFTSYAQLDHDRFLDRFITDLRRELQVLRGEPDPEPLAFFDRDGVAAGDPWSDTIVGALNEAEVLMCLMSPTYFTREWCGRELSVFLDRMDRFPGRAGARRFIFPVWWIMPTAPRPLPSRLAQFHFRDAGYPRDYDRAGGRGLARLGRWLQFRQLVSQLAVRISETLDQPHRLPLGDAAADILKIVNAFDEQQPYDVRMVVLTPGGDAWVPGAVDGSVGAAATATARRLMVFIRPVETGPGLVTGVERARDEQQVLLVVASAAVAPDALARTINDYDLPNLALLLVDAENPGVGADTWLEGMPQGSFVRARAAGLVRTALGGDMQAQMERLVDEARRRMQAGAEALPVQDSALADRAAEQGISLGVQPVLVGPGGEVRI